MPNRWGDHDNDNDSMFFDLAEKPGTKKEEMKSETQVKKDRCPSYGTMSVMGRRDEMEDAVAAVPWFCMGPTSGLHFFGVYDGHGGGQASAFCRERLHDFLAAELRGLPEEGRRDYGEREWVEVMKNCFVKMDIQLGGMCSSGKCKGDIYGGCCRNLVVPVIVGSTAVVAVVSESQIVVGNCGDSRAVLCRGGKAVPFSIDHKPEREDEMDRIEAAGGRIIFWDGYRVGGLLSMSRALGDRYLKQYVISEPEVRFTERREDDEFLILASDGLWDVLSNESACEVVSKCLAGKRPPPHFKAAAAATSSVAVAAALLAEIALARGSSDNISVVVIDLKDNRNLKPRINRSRQPQSLKIQTNL
ncbi:probable protein phosphatase 2C 24 [Cryptomeria japonica]|uniref:probable protein phosphatase 2C 24 n=1 Tax=Cryptomeria japonica TaxID=3369 RepID=UPI0027DA66AD|nr:probable protein phosphatase 2C 24 [Cryptomeria japonica]